MYEAAVVRRYIRAVLRNVRLSSQGSPYFYAEFEINGHRFSKSTRRTNGREALQAARLKQQAREQVRQLRLVPKDLASIKD